MISKCSATSQLLTVNYLARHTESVLFRAVTVSFAQVTPFDHPFRTLVFAFPVVFFSVWSLQFFRHLSRGSTFLIHRSRIQLLPGKYHLTPAQAKRGYWTSYNSPAWSAFLGFLLFTVAEILLIFLFLRPDYTFYH